MLLLFKKPATFTLSPTFKTLFCGLICLADSVKAVLRLCPASICSDLCSKSKLKTGVPLGVYRTGSSATITASKQILLLKTYASSTTTVSVTSTSTVSVF